MIEKQDLIKTDATAKTKCAVMNATNTLDYAVDCILRTDPKSVDSIKEELIKYLKKIINPLT